MSYRLRPLFIVNAIRHLSVAGLCLFALASFANAEPSNPDPIGPDEALAKLEAGNRRFAAGQSEHPHEATSYRQQLVSGQRPFATILGCSDSRVPPDLLFDQGFGDLFVIRVAGNVVDPEVSGSIEYAVDHLETPLVVVLGHESCGAVTAALDASDHGQREPHELEQLLDGIRPALAGIDATPPTVDIISTAVEANVRHSIEELSALPALQQALSSGQVRIVGAIYDLHTGRVRFLDGAVATSPN